MNPIAYIPRVISALFALTVVSAHSQPVAKPLVPRGAYAAEDLARLTPGTECGAPGVGIHDRLDAIYAGQWPHRRVNDAGRWEECGLPPAHDCREQASPRWFMSYGWCSPRTAVIPSGYLGDRHTARDVTPPYVGTRTYECRRIDGIAQWVAVAATPCRAK